MATPHYTPTRASRRLAELVFALACATVALSSSATVVQAAPVTDWSTAKDAAWACTFDSTSGVLTMQSSAQHLVGGRLPYLADPGDIRCPGAEGTPLDSVASVRVVATSSLAYGVSPTEMLWTFKRPVPTTIEVPSGADVLLAVGYSSRLNTVLPAPPLVATANGIDYNGDGTVDVTVNAATWNVAITARKVSGTFDLRQVPANPDDSVEHVFGVKPITFDGPRTGPHTTVRMEGASGDDRITTYGGDDTIIAGLGDDVIRTGGGDDLVFAGGGSDRIHAGAGSDWVSGYGDTTFGSGGPGVDRVWLGPGGDYSAAANYVWGEGGRDIMMGGYLADGGPGSDFIKSSGGPRVTLRCGAGIDFSYVGSEHIRKWPRLAPSRTGCERRWTNARRDPFSFPFWPATGGGRLTWCNAGYLRLCESNARPSAAGCIAPSRC